MVETQGVESGRPTERRLPLVIGVLAYNEADRIEALVDQIARQTVLTRADLDVTVIVVANGCTDATAAVARRALASGPIVASVERSEVHELARRGKPNAWNELIHHFIDEATTFVLMVDADISFPERNSFELVVDRLIECPDVSVAIDVVESDLRLKPKLTLLERLVLVATDTEHDPTSSITGHFYGARYEVLRTLRMPLGVIGEDGLLRAMVLTNGFESEERMDRVSLVSDARHVYESEVGVRAIVHHQIRQTLGTIVNIVLFGHIRTLRETGVELDDYIEQRNAADSAWLLELAAEEWAKPEMRSTRWRLRRRRFSVGPIPWTRLPVVVAAAMLDQVTYAAAVRKLRSRSAEGYW